MKTYEATEYAYKNGYKKGYEEGKMEGLKTMKNFISINKQVVELTDEQVEKIREYIGEQNVRLGDADPGEVIKIGSHEFIVLDQVGEATLLLRKDALVKMAFSEDNNNYAGSAADDACNEFAEELADLVGEDNILLHEVDLTADDGLKDYGIIQRKVSLRTAQMQREYVTILDKYRLDCWEWLATAYSTPTHGESTWVKCVSPAGCIYNWFNFLNLAVRPFCILKSNIFVSK